MSEKKTIQGCVKIIFFCVFFFSSWKQIKTVSGSAEPRHAQHCRFEFAVEGVNRNTVKPCARHRRNCDFGKVETLSTFLDNFQIYTRMDVTYSKSQHDHAFLFFEVTKKNKNHHAGRRWQFTERHTEGQNLQNKRGNTANVNTGTAGV